MITLCTLGQCLVLIDGRVVTPAAGRMFACVLYLAAERGRAVRRTTLAELLWPGLPVARRRHALRQLLYRVRRLGVPLCMADDRVELPATTVALTFAAAPDTARLLAEGGRDARGVAGCLPGYAGPSADFDAWVEGYRAVIEAGVRRAVVGAFDGMRRAGAWAALEAHADALLRIDPHNEAAYLARAEAATMRGAPEEGLAILEGYLGDGGGGSAAVRAAVSALRARDPAHARVGSRPGAPSAPSAPLVGREREFAALADVLTGIERGGAGAAVVLAGDAGIGKTRLAAEVATNAALRGVAVVRVACAERLPRPAGVIAELAVRLQEAPGALGCAPEALARLRRLVEGGAGAATRHPDGRSSVLAPPIVAGRVPWAVRELVEAVASEGPLLVVLDDASAMDAVSRRVLRALTGDLCSLPLFLLLLARRDGVPALVGTLGNAVAVHELAPLDAAAAARLLDDVWARDGRMPPRRDRAWCLATGAGNPLALHELAAACRVGGRRPQLPHALRALVEARLAGVRPAARRVLEAAVVLEGEATAARVARLLELPTHVLAGALGELARGGILREHAAVLVPSDGMVRAVVREGISAPVRRLFDRRRREAFAA